MEANTLWQKILKRYFINGLNGMALGLFCTLIVGLIIKQIGTFIGGDVGAFVVALGNFATMCTGAAIGVGTAYVMEAPRMVVFSSAVTGLLGANAAAFANGTLFPETGGMLLSGAGDPLGAFIAALAGLEIGRLVSGEWRKLNIGTVVIAVALVTFYAGGWAI